MYEIVDEVLIILRKKQNGGLLEKTGFWEQFY